MADHREMLRHNAFFQKVYNKEISALRLSGVSSHTPSMLRYPALRKP